MGVPVLYSIEISPWSEKARWALDFYHLPYKKVEYLTLIMAPMLKLKTLGRRKFTDKLTVPLLIDGSVVISESFDIAMYAESKAGGNQLFPQNNIEKIRELDLLSERLLNIFRAEVFRRTKDNYQAKFERLKFMPEKNRSSATPVVDFMIRFLEKKYPVPSGESTALLLQQVRSELGGRAYALNDFSYADITLAQAIQFVSPVANRYIELGDHQRQTMTNPELAIEFKDLVEWRDQLYEKHR
jgi:glutathione S-transferase